MNQEILDKKILIIAKEDVASSFRFLGIETLSVTDEKNAIESFINLKSDMDKYGIIYITEEFYKILKEEIAKFSAKTTPAIVIIPDNTGSKNLGQKLMDQAVEQATGSSNIN